MPPFDIFELLATSSCFFFRSEAACRITHSSSFSRAAARDSISSCEIKKRDAGASTTDEIDDADGSVQKRAIDTARHRQVTVVILLASLLNGRSWRI